MSIKPEIREYALGYAAERLADTIDPRPFLKAIGATHFSQDQKTRRIFAYDALGRMREVMPPNPKRQRWYCTRSWVEREGGIPKEAEAV